MGAPMLLPVGLALSNITRPPMLSFLLSNRLSLLAVVIIKIITIITIVARLASLYHASLASNRVNQSGDSNIKVGTLDRSPLSPAAAAAALLLIMAGGICSKCSSRRLDDVHPSKHCRLFFRIPVMHSTVIE